MHHLTEHVSCSYHRETKATSSWTLHHGRPNLIELVSTKLASVANETSVGIASCGPPSFTHDVRNAVAARQKLIMLDKTGGIGADEVELHTEEFGW
jgi:hypothetical protein